MAVRGATPGAKITPAQVSEAINRVIHGSHRGKLMSGPERQRVAVHEAGHAVVASALGQAANLHRVSILAQGPGLGQTSITAGSDRVLLAGTEIEDLMATALGGIAAEAMVFGGHSTTGEDDIARASELARAMVGLYGMSAGIGAVRVLARYGSYLGGDATSMEAVAESTQAAFDAEVRALVDAAAARASQLVSYHRAALDAMVDALLEAETLEGPSLEALIEAVTSAAPPPPAQTTLVGTDGSGARMARAGRGSAMRGRHAGGRRRRRPRRRHPARRHRLLDPGSATDQKAELAPGTVAVVVASVVAVVASVVAVVASVVAVAAGTVVAVVGARETRALPLAGETGKPCEGGVPVATGSTGGGKTVLNSPAPAISPVAGAGGEEGGARPPGPYDQFWAAARGAVSGQRALRTVRGAAALVELAEGCPLAGARTALSRARAALGVVAATPADDDPAPDASSRAMPEDLALGAPPAPGPRPPPRPRV